MEKYVAMFYKKYHRLPSKQELARFILLEKGE